MVPSIWASLTASNEEAKKQFVAKKFVDALKLYDEGLEKLFDENPQTLSSMLDVANESIRGAMAPETGSVGVDGVLRAAVIAAFILRLKPFYFDATATYVNAVTAAVKNNNTNNVANNNNNVRAARILLKHHLSKDGTDEEAKKLLDSLTNLEVVVDASVGEGDAAADADAAAVAMSTGVSASRIPAALEDLPAEFAAAVGNALNNAALCELKLRHFDAAAASASQALLFLSAPEARVKAVFRHAQVSDWVSLAK